MRKTKRNNNGSAFFYILMAVILIGILTVALKDNGGLVSNTDKENLNVQINQLLQISNEMEQGVSYLINNGVSESDIRLAYPGANAADFGTLSTTPQNQVFSQQGGKVVYKKPPAALYDGGHWFFGSARALPNVGSDKAEMYAGLTGVTRNACLAINKKIGLSSTPSINCGTAWDGFNGTYPVSVTLPTAGFVQLPAPRFCAYCSNKTDYLYFTTLLTR